MTELRPGLTFSIINKELDLAWDLLHEDKTFIVGARPNGKSSQKVRSKAIDVSPFCFMSNLCSVSSQWKAEKVHGHWVIVNASNQEYANVDHVEPLRPGVRLVTSKSPRNWEARFDPEFDGLR